MGRSSDARQRLIEAARGIIFAQSYMSVSVEELCAEAGVTKSSFYHFFPSKQDLVLAALESYGQAFEQDILIPTLLSQRSPHERILLFFDLVLEKQRAQKLAGGSMQGCPAGNLTLEMSTQNELLRTRIAEFFRRWTGYFKQMLCEAQALGTVPATLDTTATAEALLAYFEGVMLIAKSHNDPSLLHTLRTGSLALMQYQDQTSIEV